MFVHSFLLFLTAVIWGVAFVAQRVGMDYCEPFTFNAVRFLIGFVVLLPLMAWRAAGESRKASETKEGKALKKRTLLKGGLVCGFFLFIASNFQQFGIRYTTVGKAGFITACYILIVPILGIFLKKKVSPLIWLAVAMALTGLYLLCVKDGFSLGSGDTLVLICSVFFSFQILSVDHFAPLTDGVWLSGLQFFAAGILSLLPALVLEHPSWNVLYEARIPILYAGVMSCGVAYTLQIIGQKGLNPAVASLIMSLESGISVIAGWLILGQRMTTEEILGCVIMFLAIVLAQLPVGKREPVFS